MSTLETLVSQEVDRRAVADHFDDAFYLATNPDVRQAGTDPLLHFLTVGWIEGRNPSRSFDVGFYLSENPDIAAAGVNPLLHYIRAGVHEGRRPRRPNEAWRRQLECAAPPRTRAAGWAAAADPSRSIGGPALERALEISSNGLIVSISHDDYTQHYGGVQNLIGDEQRAFARAGWSYLHVSPLAPLPMLCDPTSAADFRVRLRLDGAWLGVAAFTDLLGAVAALRARGTRVACVVHHLMGLVPELIQELIAETGERAVVWTHDFFTLCPSYMLMRNDIAFCGNPAADSVACRICCYGEERSSHLLRMRAFFEAVRPVVLAPSTLALEFWRRRDNFPYTEAAVLPLARLLLIPCSCAQVSDLKQPLRIAHVGARAFSKGWPVFEELALRFAHDQRYAFFQLGLPDGPASPGSIRNVPVRVEAGRRNAMIEAVAEARIDVVVSWSLWPETFCYAAHEALAGGAFVVARAGAGNVWSAIVAKAPGQGCAIGDAAELFALFEGDGLLKAVAAAPRRRGALLPGNGAADWLLDRHRGRHLYSGYFDVHQTLSPPDAAREKALLADA